MPHFRGIKDACRRVVQKFVVNKAETSDKSAANRVARDEQATEAIHQVRSQDSAPAIDEGAAAKPRKASRTLKPLLAFLGAYTLFFFWLAYRKYSLFTNDSEDASLFVNTFWSTLHGRFFWNYMLGMSFFGDHTDWFMVPLLPIYWLAPYPATLLLLQSAFIAAAGVPIYLLARDALEDSRAAWCMTVAFLFFPAIVSQHVNQIHDTQFIIVFLLFAFYFYHHERFGMFTLFLALSCLGKENVPLTLMMFGVYALVQRRRWKWVIAPWLVSGIASGLFFKFIMPHFRGPIPYRSFSYFGALGDTPMAVLGKAVKNPSLLFATLLTPINVLYFRRLVQPAGLVLPFLSMPIIFALPDLMVNLLVDNTALKSVRWHYNLTVGAFLFVAVIFSVKKLSGWLTRRYGPGRYALGFSIWLVFLSFANRTLWFDPNDYREPPQYNSLRTALAQVPPRASVLVPQTMLTAVADRWNFNTIQYWLVTKNQPAKLFQYKYVIIDQNEWRPMWKVPVEIIQEYTSNPSYELIFNEQNVVVFRRVGEDTIAGSPPDPSSP
jgi:uncharacterized membrane protein